MPNQWFQTAKSLVISRRWEERRKPLTLSTCPIIDFKLPNLWIQAAQSLVSNCPIIGDIAALRGAP